MSLSAGTTHHETVNHLSKQAYHISEGIVTMKQAAIKTAM